MEEAEFIKRLNELIAEFKASQSGVVDIRSFYIKKYGDTQQSIIESTQLRKKLLQDGLIENAPASARNFIATQKMVGFHGYGDHFEEIKNTFNNLRISDQMAEYASIPAQNEKILDQLIKWAAIIAVAMSWLGIVVMISIWLFDKFFFNSININVIGKSLINI